MYHDTYVGGEEFAGEEAVWRNEVTVWAMNYIGRVLDDRFSGDFLKEALRAADKKQNYFTFSFNRRVGEKMPRN